MCHTCNLTLPKSGLHKCPVCNTWFNNGISLGKNISHEQIKELLFKQEGLDQYPQNVQDQIKNILDDLTFECGHGHDEDWDSFTLTLSKMIELVLLVPKTLNIGSVKTLNIS